jgi:hypothetical protein
MGIHDSVDNCLFADDETTHFIKDYCTGNGARHRFQCFNQEYKCLDLSALGGHTNHCSNTYDKMWYGIGDPLLIRISCDKNDLSDCYRLRDYV